MQKWGRSLRTNDLKGFLECCTPEYGHWPKAQAAFLSYVTAAFRFREALLERYGSDAWYRYTAYCDKNDIVKVDVPPDNDAWFEALRIVEMDGEWCL